MKIYFLILCTTFLCSVGKAQNTLTKLKFEEAEKAFYNADYENCIKLLDETEKLLGQPAPKILHLKIMAENKIWEANPYASYEQLERLRSLCNQYMQNYDIQGLEDKFKEVYEISTILPNASNQVELTQLKNKYEKETKAEQLEKIITENNLVFVEGGTFMMGEGKDSHEVTLSDFYIGKFEITVQQYYQYMGQLNEIDEKKRDTPIWCKTWEEAMGYCNWLEQQYGGQWRLPTEAEWEFAARGGNKSRGYKHSGSDDFDEVGWLKKSDRLGVYHFSPVGKKKPNELGIYDMSGNVTEVCLDWYDKDYYSVSPKENPMGPQSGTSRVIRGHSYWHAQSSIYYRIGVKENKSFNEYCHNLAGFRVVYIPDKD